MHIVIRSVSHCCTLVNDPTRTRIMLQLVCNNCSTDLYEPVALLIWNIEDSSQVNIKRLWVPRRGMTWIRTFSTSSFVGKASVQIVTKWKQKWEEAYSCSNGVSDCIANAVSSSNANSISWKTCIYISEVRLCSRIKDWNNWQTYPRQNIDLKLVDDWISSFHFVFLNTDVCVLV